MTLSGRGGKREGAGRRPVSGDAPGVKVSYRIPPAIDAAIRALAEQRQVSQGIVVTEALAEYLSKQGSRES